MWLEPKGGGGDGNGGAIKPIVKAGFVHLNAEVIFKPDNKEFQFWPISLCYGDLRNST